MHDAHRGKDGRWNQGRILQVGKDSPGNRRRNSRNVDSLDPRQLAEQFVPGPLVRFPLFHLIHDFQDRLLAVAYEESVEEFRHRRRVEGADASPQDHRLPIPALPAKEGDSGKVEHGEHVCVGQFVTQGKPEHVEIARGTAGFERGEGQSRGSQVLLHVPSGREGPLAERVPPGVEKLVEQEDAQMRHPDLVDIRKSQEDAGLRLFPGKERRSYFGAAVSRRFLHVGRNGSHRSSCPIFF